MKMPLAERLGVIVDQWLEQHPGTTWDQVLHEIAVLTRAVKGLHKDLAPDRVLH